MHYYDQDLSTRLRLRYEATVHRTKQNLKRGLDRANAEILRPLKHPQQEEQFTSVYSIPLPKGSIRLLTIIDDNPVAGGTLHCRLETYSLDLAPRYDAVSYCWGEDVTTTNIVCNGFNLQVRPGLMAFLRASKDRKAPSRPMWIDAVCLNQEDDAEKSLHVPLMYSIFKHASSTVVWLGEADVHTDEALQWIMKTMPKFMAKAKHSLSARGRRVKECTAAYPAEWKAASNYLSRPWFSRLWCVQEVLLSEDIQLLSHTAKFPSVAWKELSRHLSMIPIGQDFHALLESERNSETTTEAMRLVTVDKSRARDLQCTDYQRQMMRNHGYQRGVSWLQYFITGRECREPIDRIWAVLGLLSPDLVSLVHEAGIIDYSEEGRRQYWKSYLNFMRVLYEYDGGDFFEVILRDQIGRERHPLLPSWCPDFTCPNISVSLSQHRKFRAGFTDARDETAIDSALYKTGNLEVRGFKIDVVSRVTSIWETFEPRWARTISETRRAYGKLKEWLSERHQIWNNTEGDGKKSLCCTLRIADQSKDEDGDTYLDSCYSDEWLEALETLEKTFAAIACGDIDEEPEYWDYVEHYRGQLIRSCDGHRMFITEAGRIGQGPADLRQGDMICAFIGAETLFVLRGADLDQSGAQETYPDSSEIQMDETEEVRKAELEAEANVGIETEEKEMKLANGDEIKDTELHLELSDVEEHIPASSPSSSSTSTSDDLQYFKLLGDAYVYGMMFGEAFTAQGRGPDQYFIMS